jgi:hypothetical protein
MATRGGLRTLTATSSTDRRGGGWTAFPNLPRFSKRGGMGGRTHLHFLSPSQRGSKPRAARFPAKYLNRMTLTRSAGSPSASSQAQPTVRRSSRTGPLAHRPTTATPSAPPVPPGSRYAGPIFPVGLMQKASSLGQGDWRQFVASVAGPSAFPTGGEEQRDHHADEKGGGPCREV